MSIDRPQNYLEEMDRLYARVAELEAFVSAIASMSPTCPASTEPCMCLIHVAKRILKH